MKAQCLLTLLLPSEGMAEADVLLRAKAKQPRVSLYSGEAQRLPQAAPGSLLPAGHEAELSPLCVKEQDRFSGAHFHCLEKQTQPLFVCSVL